MKMWRLLRWVDRGWWSYLFSDLGDIPRASIEWEFGNFYIYKRFPWPVLFDRDESLFLRVSCRVRGHPKGAIFYNPGGYEPDWTCRTCGEDLG